MPARKKEERYLEFIIRDYGFDLDFDDSPLPPEAERLRASFVSDPYKALYGIGFTDAEEWYSESLRYLHSVSSAFVTALSRTDDLETLREKVSMDYSQDLAPLVRSVPFVPGQQSVTRQWVMLVWERLLFCFRSEIAGFDGTVELYFASKNENLHAPGRIFFHLVEASNIPFDFAFMATYSPESEDGSVRPHMPLKYALEEYRDDSRKMLALLQGISKAADRSQLIQSLMESGELFHPIGFTKEEAFTFLNEVPVYEECGILCRIPNWWRHRQRTGFSIEFDGEGFMGADSLLSCIPSITVDGVEITEREARELLEMSDGLAMLKGRWVTVNKARLKGILDSFTEFKEEHGEELPFNQAFALSVGITKDGALQEQMIYDTSWIGRAFERVRSGISDDLEVPETFNGRLRPYQDAGVRWLDQLRQLGFGACLADDMGLGKTAQILAFLVSRAGPGDRYLIVAPTSLVSNWCREISKFTPSLEYDVFASKDDPIAARTLTITTYGMVLRHGGLTEHEWTGIILDEAQAIKNPLTKQSRAVRSMKGGFRIAMTGTPVENRLLDLWSIFDFINPGLLGSETEFRNFSKGLETEEGGYSRLRTLTAPFILRRLKTDRDIISDLPDKLETVETVKLSRKQTVLYRDELRRFADALAQDDGPGRLGIILSAITKFKQICNHPDQYLGQTAFLEQDSGKFGMLREICESIQEKRERVLVFTQYREMTEPLRSFLDGVFGRRGLVFHGGMSKKERDRAVEEFNSEKEYVPFMVVSIKAGGVGLNLTAANHVIHFDRWWNPAVENQATDRAFRIGQTKDVLVHKFVCEGTMEEKIDQMINSKSELAGSVVKTGESWITKMSDAELLDMMSLG